MSSPLTAVLARVPYFAGLDPATLARLAMEAR